MISEKAYKNIEDYGIIGNLKTCALVNNEGSIEWCCFPDIESPSLFASLLDANKGGHFTIQPCERFASKQKYLENTNILPTEFSTDSGELIIIDFMPISEHAQLDGRNAIYRRVDCLSGELTVKFEFMPRFDFGRSETVLTQKHQVINAQGSKPNERAYLHMPETEMLNLTQNMATATYDLKKDDRLWFVLRYGTDYYQTDKQCEDTLNIVYDFWKSWVHNCHSLSKEGSLECVFHGPWHDIVVRSGLILKLLMHDEIGSIAAAATTSIPEVMGGIRNWDYRYNWIRDASFTIQALYNLGHVEEAKKHLKWFIDVCKQNRDPSEIQIMYGMHGEKELTEIELHNLEGYKRSRPVRIGNAAAKQKQLDVYGELINAFYETTRYERSLSLDDWAYIRRIVDYVCSVWMTKDSGIWEVRGELQHFIHSKVMCWVAVNRGLRIAQNYKFEAPLSRWRETEAAIRAFILEYGFNRRLNCFVQSAGSENVDASSLLIPIVGFLPFEDPRIQGTINAVLEKLMVNDELVYRYVGDDGLPGEEGAFMLCTFWIVNALALSGRIQEAEKVFMNSLKHVSATGLLSEEISVKSGIQLGNFPQAFSHIGLINSAMYIGRAKGKQPKGPKLIGEAN